MGSAGSSSEGYRDIRAQFAEFRLPLTEDVELNFAHRHDDYSDFGSTADNSKVFFKMASNGQSSSKNFLLQKVSSLQL